MLQIIGWIGCAILFVKSMEMLGNRGLLTDEGVLPTSIQIGAIGGLIAAGVFAAWIFIQGQAMQSSADLSIMQQQTDDLGRAADCLEAEIAGEPLPGC